MGTLAVLFAVLAVAVPLHKSASADEPPSVTITISDENYETATATITATGVTFDDWRLRVEYTTLGDDPYGRYTGSTPDLTASDLDVFSFLSNYDDNADTLSAEFTLPKLVPASDYTVTVKLSSPSFSDIYTDTDTFSTKSGCYQEENEGYDRTTDPAQKRDGSREKWFKGFGFSKVTRYELVLDVNVSEDTDLIPRNSGRCVYYNYDYHDGAKKVRVPTIGWSSAYVHVRGGGVKAWIKPNPPLIPGTYYDFHVNFDPLGGGAGKGTGTSTLAPALIISVDDIEQTSAEVTVTLPADLQDEGERMIHLVAYKTADEYDPDLNSKQVKPEPETTENSSTSFALSNLTPGTEYKVKASLMWSFPTHHTASKTFTTKLEPPGKPTDLEVAPGDRQLEVSWQAPEGDGVGITGYEVEYRKDGEQTWTASSASVDEETDSQTDVTTYKSIISSLDVSTLYDVRVSAVNSSTEGDEDAYNWAEGSGTTLPDFPKSLEVTPGIEQLTLSWDEPAETGTVAITGYLVEYKKNTDDSWTSLTRLSASRFGATINGLDNDVFYDVRVRAVNIVVLDDDDDYNWATSDGTPVPDPGVSLVVKERSQTGATLTANISNGNDEDHTVHLRFREKTTTGWTDASDETSSNDSAEFTLSSLDAGTTYEVKAWLNDDQEPADSDTFEFYTLPTVAGITFSEQNRDSAKATVSLTVSDIDTTSHTVHLRYREKDATPEASWIDATDIPATSGSAEFTLGSLDAGTIYEVQAWLDNDSPPADSDTSKTFEFYTLAEVATVTVSDEGQTTAKATVSLDVATEDDTTKTVHLQYGEDGTPPSSWVPFTPPKTTTTDSVEFSLTGLKSDTDYRVEAWTEDDFDNVTAPFDTFRTLRPTVSNVEVEDRKEQETATVTVTIDEPNGEDQQVFLRYRPAIQQDWSTDAPDAGGITDISSSTSTASVPIRDLKSGTLYEVEASLESGYYPSETTTFTTKGASLNEITISEVMQESAKATIDIEAPNGQSQMIYVRFRKVTDPVNTDWTDADPTTSTTETAIAPLSNLTSGTKYEAQASLDDSFPGTESVTITSLPFTTDPPSLKGLSVMDTVLTEATIKATIEAPNEQTQTVHLQYREKDATPEAEWSTPPEEADVPDEPGDPKDNVAITLSGLKSSTTYEVRASLNISPADASATIETTSFTTTTPNPSISGVLIGDETQTTAVATVTIALPGTGTNQVHLQYRKSGESVWGDALPPVTATGATATVNIDNGLDADTSYEAQVSLSNTFTNPWVVPFETIPYPSVRSVAVTDFDKTTAEVTVAIEDEDGVSREVHLRYIVSSDNPDWVPDWANDGKTKTTKTD